MARIAPEIVRQRLVIEGYFNRKVAKTDVEKYLKGVAKHLNLRTYGKAAVFSPSGIGKSINQGFDAFLPLIDSGISLYVWGNAKFFSAVIYTCKKFDNSAAIKYTKKFFRTNKVAVTSF